MRKRISLIIILLSLASAAAAAAVLFWPASRPPQAMEINPIHLSDFRVLDQGKIVVKEIPGGKTPGKTFEAFSFIHCDLDQVYKKLIQFDQCVRYMPRLKKAEILDRGKNWVIVNYTLEVGMGKIKRYRLLMSHSKKDNQAKIEWKLIPWPGLKPKETIRYTEGFWHIQKFSMDTNRVLLTFHVYADPGEIPKGLRWLVNCFTKKSLPETIESVKKQLPDHDIRQAKITERRGKPNFSALPLKPRHLSEKPDLTPLLHWRAELAATMPASPIGQNAN